MSRSIANNSSMRMTASMAIHRVVDGDVVMRQLEAECLAYVMDELRHAQSVFKKRPLLGWRPDVPPNLGPSGLRSSKPVTLSQNLVHLHGIQL
jgi:hypothetical protein